MKKNWIEFQYEDPPVLEEYTEQGSGKGAKIGDRIVDSPDMLRIYLSTKHLNLADSLKWIDDNAYSFEDSTVVIDTDDGNSLKSLSRLYPEVLVNKRSLNTIRHLNTFLNRANDLLEEGGYIWCHARTAVLKKKLILSKYPKPFGHIIYAFHYLWHRVCAKMPLVKKFYFWVTGGSNRTYNRVEVLGRMYRAGFEVLDEEFRLGEFFVLGRKFKEPIWDVEPNCGPIIKLNRVGKDGKTVGVYKFRTMYSYSEYLQPYIYKYAGLQDGGKFADDYRVNFWGKILRATWLDEFPMFINFFKGDLKLVGVRPLSRHYFSLYTPEMQELRIKVKPGLIPPFYYEEKSPVTIEEVQESERRYIQAYLNSPFKTDWRYFWGSLYNIFIKRKRSK